MKVTLDRNDINEACREWLERHYKITSVSNPMSFNKEGVLTVVYDVDLLVPPAQPYR